MGIIDKLTEAFISWCARDTAAARFQRSMVQGVLGVIAGGVSTGEWSGAVVVGVITAILAPIQKAIGNKGEV